MKIYLKILYLFLRSYIVRKRYIGWFKLNNKYNYPVEIDSKKNNNTMSLKKIEKYNDDIYPLY